MSKFDHYDAIVLGGGFYGSNIAISLKSVGLKKVLLLEPRTIGGAATTANQNRIHSGLHYPRFQRTAESAAKSYKRFLADYAVTIDANKRHIYAIGEGSKTSPAQFEEIAKVIGTDLVEIKPPDFFNSALVQKTYEVEEVAFNITKMVKFIWERLNTVGVEVIHDFGVVMSANENIVEVWLRKLDKTITCNYLFNCTYAKLDLIGVPIVTNLKKEYTEVALMMAPPVLEDTDITIMNGNFWSLMRYPSEGCHALTHVQYTPHWEWFGGHSPRELKDETAFPKMIEDASRYVPKMKEAIYKGSIFTTRVVLETHEEDDGRPILWEYSPISSRIISILGSKFNSIYDAIAMVNEGEWRKDEHPPNVRVVGRRALIGHTGVVGRNIDYVGRFTSRYNTKNSGEMGGDYELVVCAGVSGTKWWANENPVEDINRIMSLWENLKRITARKFVLISSVDATRNTPYGWHRQMLEKLVQERFKDAVIIRLPAVFGKGLRKNVLFDLLTKHRLKAINPATTLQWYPLSRLWDDMKTAKVGINSFFTEPVNTGDLVHDFFPELESLIGKYDIRTADLYEEEPWRYNELIIYKELEKFIHEWNLEHQT